MSVCVIGRLGIRLLYVKPRQGYMVKSTIFITVYRWKSIKYRWAHVSRVYAYEIWYGTHDSVTSAFLIINKYMFFEHPNWKKIFSYLIWRVFQHAHIMYIYFVIEIQPFHFRIKKWGSTQTHPRNWWFPIRYYFISFSGF